MKNVVFFFILLLIDCYAVGQGNWQEKYYNYYNYQNITDFAAINDTIVPEDFDSKLLNALIFYETNKQRALNGRKELKHDQRLENCAQGHSQDMVNYNFYSHKSTVPGKYDVSDRTSKYGISETYIGENISQYYIIKFNGQSYQPPSQAGYFKSSSGMPIPIHTYQSLAIEIGKGWMDSPGHRANILNSNYTHLGVGTSSYYEGFGIDKIPYVKSTQNFAQLKLPLIYAYKENNSNSNKKNYISNSSSSSSLSSNSQSKSKKQLEAIAFGGGYAGIFNSFDDYFYYNMDYQIFMIFGGYWGKRGYGQNFWGVFPSIDLYEGYPITIEAGCVLSRFLRLSIGPRFQPFLSNNTIEYQTIPSATVGIQLHLWILYASLDLNSFYFNGNINQRFITSVGISF